jgi:hypothetical protein
MLCKDGGLNGNLWREVYPCATVLPYNELIVVSVLIDKPGRMTVQKRRGTEDECRGGSV